MAPLRPASAGITFAAVILGAGSSSRMGKPKLLLPWGSTSVLGHLWQSWKESGASQVAVVCAANAADVHAELDRLGFPRENRIFNPEPQRGMFSSIQCAAAWSGWKRELTQWAITLGDQPHLKRQTIESLLDCGAANPDKICQPLQNGRPRHPVLLPRWAWTALAGTRAKDLKAFLRLHAKDFVGFDANDPGLDLDLDVPEDYERARRLYVSNS
jgi:molybdenum cofactor cytidylyltransferase